MSIKRMLMLASMALAAIAFAAPAAQAQGWTHEGEPLAEEVTFKVSGPAQFNIGGSPTGAHGTVHATIHLKPGTTGWVSDFTVTNCTGTGELAGLNCTASEQAQDWVIHAKSGGTILATDINVHNVYFHPLDVNHAEPLATSLLTGNLEAIPDNATAISSLSLEEMETHVRGPEGEAIPAEVSGTLAVVGSDAGTYGSE